VTSTTPPTPSTSLAGAALPPGSAQPFLDIVDFVERTTYAIWNDRQPELVGSYYGPRSVIRSDSGDLVGGDTVTAATRERMREFPDYRGLIHDTIWTGDDASGYRTSMRWTARGTLGGGGADGPADRGAAASTGAVVHNSAIANCVVLHGQYVEEWAGENPGQLDDQLGIDSDSPATLVPEVEQQAPVHSDSPTAVDHGATVPAVPERVDGPGLLVVELLHDLYDRRDLGVVERVYAAGAPYTFGATRWQIGHQGVRAEVGRWLDLLPDSRATVDELYWVDEAPGRARVAVRFRVSGTAAGDRPVEIMSIHHLHVRGGLVVAEWSEYDELALRRQLRGTGRPAG
jgi:hypothetical protein